MENHISQWDVLYVAVEFILFDVLFDLFFYSVIVLGVVRYITWVRNAIRDYADSRPGNFRKHMEQLLRELPPPRQGCPRR